MELAEENEALRNRGPERIEIEDEAMKARVKHLEYKEGCRDLLDIWQRYNLDRMRDIWAEWQADTKASLEEKERQRLAKEREDEMARLRDGQKNMMHRAALERKMAVLSPKSYEPPRQAFTISRYHSEHS